MALFVINTNGVVRSQVLSDDRVVVIGRAREADVHLDDPSLSRRHCEVRRVNGQWMLKDLGSFNGTYCNNNQVTEHKLQHDDQVQLGMSVLTFQLTADERRRAGMIGTDPGGDSSELVRRLRNFMSLVEVSKAMSSELDTSKLLELVVEKGIGLTNAERGFLIRFRDGEHTFEVARNRAWQPIDKPETKISRSVIANVFSTGEPVLTIDAQADLAGMSQTIAALEVWSLMCAPLKVKERVLGCFYVDSSVAEQEFSQDSLNLLQAFADQAAIAIENAELYQDMQKSREAEKHVRQVFQKYVPKDVVQRALKISDGGRLSAKQVATVLFSDIRGFTSISERMQPEEVVAFLNDYLQRMVAIVFDEGGIVDKFIGDAVMAVFGAPVGRPDDAQRAVRAAQRMLEELDRFNLEQAQRGGVHIRIGIGIHTGPLIAGNIGSDRKMEYTVIGDTVNIASRVQDLTKEFGVEIIITQGCLEATDRQFAHRALPPVHVKGKEQALTVFEVARPPPLEDDEIDIGGGNADRNTVDCYVSAAGDPMDAATVPAQTSYDHADDSTIVQDLPVLLGGELPARAASQPSARAQMATQLPGNLPQPDLRPSPVRPTASAGAMVRPLAQTIPARPQSAAGSASASRTDAPTAPPRTVPVQPVPAPAAPPAAVIPPPPSGHAPSLHSLRGATLRRPLGPPPAAPPGFAIPPPPGAPKDEP